MRLSRRAVVELLLCHIPFGLAFIAPVPRSISAGLNLKVKVINLTPKDRLRYVEGDCIYFQLLHLAMTARKFVFAPQERVGEFMKMLHTLKSVLLVAAVCSVANWDVGTAQAGAIPAYTMTGLGDQTIPPYHFSLGYTFSTSQPVVVSALGMFDPGGNTIPLVGGDPVKLYYSALTPDTTSTVDGGQTSGTPVPGFSVNVTSADPIFSISGGAYTTGDGFRYHALASPLVLPAGTYELEGSQPGNSNQTFGANATGLVAAPGVNAPFVATYTLPNDSAGYATTTAGGNGYGNFGPNFQVVPEPSSFILCGLGALGLFAVARRRRKA